MTLFGILSLINVMFLILAHLNTWLPITFRVFEQVQVRYTSFIAGLLGFVFVLRFVRKNGYPPDLDHVHKAIYGSGLMCVLIQYRLNWLSAFFYQIVLWLLTLLFGS